MSKVAILQMKVLLFCISNVASLMIVEHVIFAYPFYHKTGQE